MSLGKIILVVVSLVFSAPALAEDCTRYYRYDTDSLRENTSLQIAILKSIDRSNYKQVSKSFSGSGGFDFFGFSLGGDADYDEFSEQRSRYLSQFEFNMSDQQAREISRAYLNSNSATNVAQCLRNNALSNHGFHAWITQIVDNIVLVDMFWNPTVSDQPLDVKVSSIGGSVLSDKVIKFTGSGFASARFKKDGSDSAFIGTIEPTGTGIASQNISIPALPPVKKPVIAPKTERDKIIEAFKAGKTCFTTLKISRKDQYCLGTLVRYSSAPYKITWVGGSKWHVWGQKCDHSFQDATYSAQTPDHGVISMWGEPFKIAENGVATSIKDPKVSGKILCP